MVKIVHFADLHLDRAFAWAGPAAASGRRENQRKVLRRIVELAQEVEADALFCGGDLYEHDRITRDTAEFLVKVFESLSPTRVFLAPGNHDWYGPESPYAARGWSDNVHIFRAARFEPTPLGDGVTLWGAAHLAPANTDNFLRDFRVEGDGCHLALFHGAEKNWLTEQGVGKEPHAAFDAVEIERARFTHAFLGHYHRPRDSKFLTYPGNPDPLEFGETGDRGVVIASVEGDGEIHRERRRVALTETRDLALDLTGCTTRGEVTERLEERASGASGFVRLTVSGDLHPDMDLEESHLRQCLRDFDAVQVRWEVRPAYDFAALREEDTVRGQFVRDVLEADLMADEERRVLMTGLRALDGREDLEVP